MPIIIQRLNTVQLILRMNIEANIHKLQNWHSCGARSKINCWANQTTTVNTSGKISIDCMSYYSFILLGVWIMCLFANIPVVNFPFICSNIPAASAHWVYISLWVDTIFHEKKNRQNVNDNVRPKQKNGWL